MTVYGFKDRGTAERAERNNRSNPNSTEISDFQNYTLPARVRVVELTEDIDGAGDPEESGAYEKTDADIVRTSVDPPERLETNGGFITQIEAAPLESTNLPEDARVLAITDTFNQTFLMTLNPSEVFGKLNEYWNGTDFNTEVEVNLDDGFTVNGNSAIHALPSKTLTEKLAYDTNVTCRYIKSKGKWFFFRQSPEQNKIVQVAGNAFNLSGTYVGYASMTNKILISQIAMYESVQSSQMKAVPQMNEITGKDSSHKWIKFTTLLSAPPSTIEGSLPVQDVRWIDKQNNLYASGSGSSWKISQFDYYGPVIKVNGGEYFYPGERLINGERWWSTKRILSNDFIYFTAKYDNQGGTSYGWTLNNTLGAFLAPDSQAPFVQASSQAQRYQSLVTLLSQNNMSFSKPEWTRDSEFGEYQPNALASGTIQLGSGRWVASDGRTGITPFYFVRSCNYSSSNQSKRWNGKYTCQAFEKSFNNIQFGNIGDQTNGYCLGNPKLSDGVYFSSSEPSSENSLTFTYTKSNNKGLFANLKYRNTNNSGVEQWILKLKGTQTSYTYTHEENSNTFNGTVGNVFGNITKSGNTWTLNGANSTIGNCVFTGDLSKYSGNHFDFQHSITLTFDTFVKGDEFEKVYVISPEVMS